MNDFRSTELAFYPGGRPYNNKDFRVLQQLVLDTTSFLQAFQNINAGEFIVSGCTSIGDEGFVWLGAYNMDPSLNGKHLRYVEAYSGPTLTYPCYIVENNSSQTRTYKDGQVKDVFLITKANWSQTIPGSGNYITISTDPLIDPAPFENVKFETFLGSIGASFWVTGGSGIEYMSGNVGIGVTPSANRLSVNGTIDATNLSISNNVNVGGDLDTNILNCADIFTTGNVTIAGALNLSSLNLTNGNITTFISNNATINNLTVNTSSSLSGGTTMSGGATVTGNVGISGGALTVSGITNTTSLNVTNNIAVSSGNLAITSGNITLSSGTITISGTGTASDWIATSDITLKDNISPIENALDIALQLEGHTYTRKDENNSKLHYGFIAQEVEKIVPELVEFINDEQTLKGVNYTKAVPILVEALKSQQKTIDDLTFRLEILESKLKNI